MWNVAFEVYSTGTFTFIAPALQKFPRQLLTNSFVKDTAFPYLSLLTPHKCLSTDIQFQISKLKTLLKKYMIDWGFFVSCISS